MRILPDECVDQRLRHLFAEHECQTAGYANLSGLKNGVLAAAPNPLVSKSWSRIPKGARLPMLGDHSQ